MFRYDPPSDPDTPVDDLDQDPVFSGKAGGGPRWARRQEALRATRDEHAQDLAIDMNENDLHAGTGQVCSLCHQVIAAGQDVRLRFDGTYQHEVCPLA